MRGRKDEEKSLSPMFPRLNVNDTEKGGPRAPPRNKMALYEQLTIPTQKFSSGSPSTSAQPKSSFVPSSSSGQMVGHKRSLISPFSKFSAQSHQVEKKLHSHASGEAMENNMAANNEQKFVKTSVVSGPLSSSPQSNSIGNNKLSNPSTNIREKLDFSVSAFDQEITEQPKNDVQKIHDRERMSISTSSSAKRRIAIEPQTDIALVDCESRESPKLAKGIQNPVEKPSFIPSVRDEVSTEENTSSSRKFEDSEKAMQPLRSLGRENSSSLSNSNRLFGANVRTFQEGLAEQNTEALKDKVGCTKVPCLENSSTVIKESSLALSPRDNLRGVDGEGNISDSSMEEPVTAPDISPDVVVGVIGEKQFWKARKAIVHQQRIFGVQVFELHRLIKVQKLIAESPHVLVEDYLDKPLSTVAAVKNKPTEYSKTPPPSSTPKDKNPPGKLPLPSLNKDNSKLLITQQKSYELHLKNPPEAPPAAATATKSGLSEPWRLNPIPGNQWLVPVMSPSEGLIYKPYAEPFPPNAGYLPPIYGNCGSISLNSGSADYFATGFSVPQHQGVGFFPGAIPLNHAYFPPYGPPVPNQSWSGSATDQMSHFVARVKSTGPENQLSTGDADYLTHLQISSDMPSQLSHEIPFLARKLHRSNGSELQGSTASSPSERGNGEVLPLFPTEPVVEESCPNAESSEHKSRAIKAVPHNPRSATESAARIFQLIQEERRQL